MRKSKDKKVSNKVRAEGPYTPQTGLWTGSLLQAQIPSPDAHCTESAFIFQT